jgi:hypothetical protein
MLFLWDVTTCVGIFLLPSAATPYISCNFLSRVRQPEYESDVTVSYCKAMNALSLTSTPGISLTGLAFIRDNFPFTTSFYFVSVVDFECSLKIAQGTGFETVIV